MSRPSTGRGTIVVGGALAQRPRIGGHAWVFLNWLLGLRSLGWDALFVDRLEPSMLPPAMSVEGSDQWRWLSQTLDRHGFDGCYALLYDGGRRCLGLSRDELLARCTGAAAFLNVMGYIDDAAVLEAARARVYVDIDPGFPQMWCDLGLYDGFESHDHFVTVGLNVGAENCSIPTCGRSWIPTLPPVALDHWPAIVRPSGRTRVTGVCTWRGPYGPVEHGGVTYGLRVHEFRRLAGLPSLVSDVDFELALAIDAADAADHDLLTGAGWSIVDPAVVARDPDRYRAYLQRSSAELLIAKNLYVKSTSGWVSDRSACYLASGRPVVAQDTGFAKHVAVGEGLVAFSDLAGAADALAEVLGNPERHAKAARDLAVDCFDARKVLAALLERVEVG